jgi:hypothetical protein
MSLTFHGTIRRGYDNFRGIAAVFVALCESAIPNHGAKTAQTVASPELRVNFPLWECLLFVLTDGRGSGGVFVLAGLA